MVFIIRTEPYLACIVFLPSCIIHCNDSIFIAWRCTRQMDGFERRQTGFLKYSRLQVISVSTAGSLIMALKSTSSIEILSFLTRGYGYIILRSGSEGEYYPRQLGTGLWNETERYYPLHKKLSPTVYSKP